MNEKKAVAMAYVVAGETGEASDRRAWFIRAFLKEEAANELRDKFNDWCKERGFYEPLPPHVRHWENKDRPPEDPNFHLDYTGTQYSVIAIPLGDVDKLPVHK